MSCLPEKGSIVLWRDEFEIGVNQIDAAHQRLVSAVTELEIASESGDPEWRIREIAVELTEFMADHLESESRIGRKHRICGMSAYDLCNQQTLDELNGLAIQAPTNIDGVAISAIARIVLAHIQADLKGFGVALRRHGLR